MELEDLKNQNLNLTCSFTGHGAMDSYDSLFLQKTSKRHLFWVGFAWPLKSAFVDHRFPKASTNKNTTD